MKPFNGLGHIAFKVKDLGASIAFYEKLGFPEMLRLLNHEGEPWIVYVRISDDLYLELFPNGKGDKVPPADQVGLTHLCLTSTNLDETEAHLQRVGIALSSPRKDKRGVDGNRGMWIEDPDGHRIEIMEMAADCIQYKAVQALAAGEKPAALSLF
jgi:catechol 2,3-dioxygenase-like lactoylglutathione lyase family enzyme